MAARNLSVVAARILKNVEEIGSRQGVPHELLQGLQETISKLAPLLLDAEEMSWDDDRVKDWVMKLDDALYDADNLLGELSTEALQQSTGDKMFKKVRNYFFTASRLKNMRQGINNIGKRLDEIAAQGRDLNLKERREKEFMESDKNVIVLMNFFRVGAKGSKIIVTTRSLPVANIRGTIEHYEFGTLSEHQSRLLFEEMTSGKRPKTAYQEEVGMDIVEKCQGHPLLLKTIASMLQLEGSEAEWRFFYEDEFLKIWNDGYKYGILSLLKLCYDHLPSPLKHCVAYCGLFPEDHEYDVQILIKLWMAQDFIIDQPGKSLEDVGYEYVLDLIRRCFFQAAEIDVR